MNQIIRKIGIGFVIAMWVVLSLSLWFGPKEDYTYSERRKLAQMPEVSLDTIIDGKFMPDFEEFTLDQFPLRDQMRQVKSLFHYYVMGQKDNNGIYLVDDTVAKIEYPLSKSSVNYATGRLNYLYETYLQNTDCKLYASIVPDKGYYLAAQNGYPAMDYEALFAAYQQALPWANYVDITDLLSPADYYRTDTHWRQERIQDVAERLLEALGAPVPREDYTQQTLETPFYGVYFGQAALPMEPENLAVLKSHDLAQCQVFDHLTGEYSDVYNMDKLTSPDLYDVYLSGAQALLTVENPNGKTDKELVIFRDSFGSSITPLLLQDYRCVHLVDIRYIHPDEVGRYLTFADQDVLFLYSTLILNSGRSLK